MHDDDRKRGASQGPRRKPMGFSRRPGPTAHELTPTQRRLARERVVQFLFGLVFTGYDWREVLEAFWAANATKPRVRAHADRLIAGVMGHVRDLDAELEAAFEKWAPERVGAVERSVLRLALYELRHEPNVPPAVAINEAIEVAKRFGADASPKFVNGILDRLRKG